jgi:hypothetical protein
MRRARFFVESGTVYLFFAAWLYSSEADSQRKRTDGGRSWQLVKTARS